MKDVDAFRQTSTGYIKRKSHRGNIIIMYVNGEAEVRMKNGKYRGASRSELIGFNNWIPYEDDFE